ncbi:TPA: hypothetical protein PL572_004492 [Cronobacter turicensis]|nr:hypothetical protein [Cronobacter turicensis]
MTASVIQPISFSFHEIHDVRIQAIDGEPWFCLKDVCDILGIKNSSDLLSKQLDKAGVDKIYLRSGGQSRPFAFVNEPNLYRVIFRSNKPEARQFQDWVFNEVLPTIRKTGRYEHPAHKPARQAREPLSRNDLQNLTGLIHDMACTFHFQDAWNRAIWFSLRRATGVPSTERFSVDDLPALASECRRIMEITGLVSRKMKRFEKEAMRRILRNREDCRQVMGQLESELDDCRLDGKNIRALERFERLALSRLENRAQFPLHG